MKQILILLLVYATANAPAIPPGHAEFPFEQGTSAYEVGAFDASVDFFRQAVSRHSSPGALQNLGNAEWKAGHPGQAILAWERAQWTDPFNANSRNNLRFARKARLLDATELPWYEICSSWLPVNAWAWLACFSFWLAAAMVMLPGIFRWRRMGWHQALAAAGFAAFLLTLPAMYGVRTRSRLAVVLAPRAILRLTPTAEAQPITRLADGETVRLERERGRYEYVRTANGAGWIQRGECALIAGD